MWLEGPQQAARPAGQRRVARLLAHPIQAEQPARSRSERHQALTRGGTPLVEERPASTTRFARAEEASFRPTGQCADKGKQRDTGKGIAN